MAIRESAPMKWCILADFFSSTNSRWLDDFIDHPSLEFVKVPPDTAGGDWHSQRSMTTGLRKWFRHLAHARKALAARPDGIITCFPQLAMSVGLMLRMTGRRIPVVAHNFNIGALAPGLRQRIARLAASRIDRFLVHSPSEVAPYAAYLGVPEDRVRFVALQRPAPMFARDEDTESPFLLAMGSAHRDYATMIEALEPLRYRTIIVTREDIIARLPERPWIEYRHGLSSEECLQLLGAARISVTPVSNMETASGQVTFINAMRMGVPLIVTRCPGAEGYVTDGDTGLLATPFDAADMRAKIDALWTDADLRRKMGISARRYAEEHFSDEAAAATLRDILLTYVRTDPADGHDRPRSSGN